MRNPKGHHPERFLLGLLLVTAVLTASCGTDAAVVIPEGTLTENVDPAQFERAGYPPDSAERATSGSKRIVSDVLALAQDR